MTIAVTRNLPDRFHGFLCSCMLEVAPGTYVVPSMKSSVRDRVWKVMKEWASLIPPEEGGLILMWNSPNAPSGIEVRTLGWSKKEFVDHEGLWLTHQMLTQEDDLSELEGLRLTKDGKGDEDDPSIE